MLQESYQEKREKNAHFSMNAFANFLGVSPSQLNEIFKGKCGLSRERAKQIVEKLNFSELQKKLFCLSVIATHSRSKKEKSDAKKELLKLKKDVSVQIQLDVFSVISCWYHFAILELLNLDEFEPSVKWISKRLNVESGLISQAVQRLIKVGLIREESGNWVRSEGLIQTTNDIPSIGIKKYHSQVLRLADAALFRVPLEKREFNSVFLAIDEELIPYAKKRIRKFQQSMVSDLSGKGKHKSRLVGLNIQMFPVDL